MVKRDKVILVILDGLGLAPLDNRDSNAFLLARKPYLDQIWTSNPMCRLHCSGRAVGLPEGQMGNSEVGHQNMGAGRIVYQDITRIDLAIEQGEFGRNPVLQETFSYVQQHSVTLHLIGLVSDGGVHSSLEHLKALLQEAKKAGLNRVCIHALMDGRDTPPHSGVDYLQQLEAFCAQLHLGQIASVMGRYYGMDRDNRWERVEKAYRALAEGEGRQFPDAEAAIRASYERGVTDEFVDPSVIVKEGQPVGKIQDQDAVIFFNFRADRARELTLAFTQPEFSAFPRQSLRLHYVTMTQYRQDFALPILFPPHPLHKILGEIVAEAGMKQLRLAETEKYAHVTFFFNGGEERVFPGEERLLVPSPKVATYDLKPEMSAAEVTQKAVEALSSEKYNLIVLNYANCDMVGHTGILAAAIKAVEAVNKGIEQVHRAALAHDYTMILTADHGNCEMMVDPVNGGPFTAHTTFPVPCFVLDRMTRFLLQPEARLCAIAPTILHLLDLPRPPEMDCDSIITGVG